MTRSIPQHLYVTLLLAERSRQRPGPWREERERGGRVKSKCLQFDEYNAFVQHSLPFQNAADDAPGSASQKEAQGTNR